MKIEKYKSDLETSYKSEIELKKQLFSKKKIKSSFFKIHKK